MFISVIWFTDTASTEIDTYLHTLPRNGALPIYGLPHFGHADEAIATDVMARFQRARGRDVRLVTGTDEHGLKMFQTARDQGRATIELADEIDRKSTRLNSSH